MVQGDNLVPPGYAGPAGAQVTAYARYATGTRGGAPRGVLLSPSLCGERENAIIKS